MTILINSLQTFFVPTLTVRGVQKFRTKIHIASRDDELNILREYILCSVITVFTQAGLHKPKNMFSMMSKLYAVEFCRR